MLGFKGQPEEMLAYYLMRNEIDRRQYTIYHKHIMLLFFNYVQMPPKDSVILTLPELISESH